MTPHEDNDSCKFKKELCRSFGWWWSKRRFPGLIAFIQTMNQWSNSVIFIKAVEVEPWKLAQIITMISRRIVLTLVTLKTNHEKLIFDDSKCPLPRIHICNYQTKNIFPQSQLGKMDRKCHRIMSKLNTNAPNNQTFYRVPNNHNYLYAQKG